MNHERLFPFRHRRNTHEVRVSFDFVLTGIYNPNQTAGEMDAGATNQFTALRNFVQEHINNGGLDIDGLTIRTNSFTSASESLLVCQLGELVEYITFTCSK